MQFYSLSVNTKQYSDTVFCPKEKRFNCLKSSGLDKRQMQITPDAHFLSALGSLVKGANQGWLNSVRQHVGAKQPFPRILVLI